MALVDSLNAELAQVVALRAQVVAKPKPNYSIDGESWSWAEYYQMLLTQQIELEKALQRAAGPIEMRTRMQS